MLKRAFGFVVALFLWAQPVFASSLLPNWMHTCAQWMTDQGMWFLGIETDPLDQFTRDYFSQKAQPEIMSGLIRVHADRQARAAQFYTFFHWSLRGIGYLEAPPGSVQVRFVEEARRAVQEARAAAEKMELMGLPLPELRRNIAWPDVPRSYDAPTRDAVLRIMRTQLVYWASLDPNARSVVLLEEALGLTPNLDPTVASEFHFLVVHGDAKLVPVLRGVMDLARYSANHSETQKVPIGQFVGVLEETIRLINLRSSGQP